MHQREYATYMLTNWERTVLYTGVTNNLRRRLLEHWRGKEGSFTTKYQVYHLVWYENSRYVLNAIRQEKDMKALLREKKEELIRDLNPELRFLNAEYYGYWPPKEDDLAALDHYLAKNPEEFER